MNFLKLAEQTALKAEVLKVLHASPAIRDATDANIREVLADIIDGLTPVTKAPTKTRNYRAKNDDPFYQHRIAAHRIRTDLRQAGQNGIETTPWEKYTSPDVFKQATVAKLMDLSDDLRDRMGKARYDRERYA